MIWEECPRAQNTFTDWGWQHYIIQLAHCAIRGDIVPGESTVSGKSSYILLGTDQEKEGYEPRLGDWIGRI